MPTFIVNPSILKNSFYRKETSGKYYTFIDKSSPSIMIKSTIPNPFINDFCQIVIGTDTSTFRQANIEFKYTKRLIFKISDNIKFNNLQKVEIKRKKSQSAIDIIGESLFSASIPVLITGQIIKLPINFITYSFHLIQT